MITENIYKKWISEVDLTKTRIVKFPSFIFLCGGKTSDPPRPEKFLSCREMFYTYITQNKSSFHKKIILAEKVFEYFEHSDYQNLLDFERDLAELSSLTVLFSESPGSIAELGCFAVIETIRERLLVVIHEDNANEGSFIWRGPVLALKNLAESKKNINPISVYKWQEDKDTDGYLINGVFPGALDLVETIESMIEKRSGTTPFEKDRTGHIMLLIISFIEKVQIALLDEVCFALESFCIGVGRVKVKQYLSLLASLGLIEMKQYSNNVFYLAPQSDWLAWGYNSKAGKKGEADRWDYQFTDFYRVSQQVKTRALRSYLESTG